MPPFKPAPHHERIHYFCFHGSPQHGMDIDTTFTLSTDAKCATFLEALGGPFCGHCGHPMPRAISGLVITNDDGNNPPKNN